MKLNADFDGDLYYGVQAPQRTVLKRTKSTYRDHLMQAYLDETYKVHPEAWYALNNHPMRAVRLKRLKKLRKYLARIDMSIHKKNGG